MSAPAPPEGPRVLLRPPRPDDLALLADWYMDPELVAPFDRYALDSLEGIAESVAAAPSDPGSLAPRFVVERRSDGRTVGCVGHYLAHPVLSWVDVWYVLGDPSARGRGLGTEAVGLLVGHVLGTAAVERVGITCDVENIASMRLAERLGFRREGTLRSALHHHARWHDVAVYGITRAEWASRPKGPGRTPPGPEPPTSGH